MTELSGVWKIGIKEGKLLGDLKPTLLQLTFDGKTEDVGLEQDALENGVLKLQAHKTFHLYHIDPTELSLTLKGGAEILATGSFPHSREGETEEITKWVELKTASGRNVGQLKIESIWMSKTYVIPSGTNYALPCAYVLVFSLLALANFISIPVSANLITTTLSIIYIGCHRSLRLRDHGIVRAEEQETISKEDAYKFPLIGSSVLFGLYILFKVFDKALVNLLLSLYFSLIGTYLLTFTFEPFVSSVVGQTEKRYGFVINLPWLGVLDTRLSIPEMISGIFAVSFSGLYVKTKHWVLNNIFGIAFSIQGIERISLGSYKVGAILLIGLFFYDIFWVFGTEVMVTVAKSFDAPIKLLFPRKLPPAPQDFSMLGLGDIVIPGIFLALLLRYDAERRSISPKSALTASFPKPVFNVTFLCYFLGLGMTILIMYHFKAAQPALLYLVPACILGSSLTALIRGEAKELLAYSEEEEAIPNKAKSDELAKKEA